MSEKNVRCVCIPNKIGLEIPLFSKLKSGCCVLIKFSLLCAVLARLRFNTNTIRILVMIHSWGQKFA